MSREILKIEHVERTYSDGDTLVRALSDINLTVEQGELVKKEQPSPLSVRIDRKDF